DRNNHRLEGIISGCFRAYLRTRARHLTMTPLTRKERELVTLLKRVSGSDVWAITINRVLDEGISWKTRRLIADLKSQRADDPTIMRMIIGQEANHKLATI